MKSLRTFGDDLVQPFQLESSLLRGRLVRLGSTLDLILHQHAYPTAIAALLGEAIVIAAALGTALKYEGVFTFQVKSEGLVKLLVADVTNEGGIRAYAQHQPLPISGEAGKLLGAGYLAFTIDQKPKMSATKASSPSRVIVLPKLYNIIFGSPNSCQPASWRPSIRIPWDAGTVAALCYSKCRAKGGTLMKVTPRLPMTGLAP